MSMFASKTPRDLNHDPEPYDVRGENNRWRYNTAQAQVILDNPDVYAPRITATYDPRPEFDCVQHNEPNPILVSYRHGDVDTSQVLSGRSMTITHRDGVIEPLHMVHAIKVLTRLARLEEVDHV